MYEIIAQSIGVLGMVVVVLSFQNKTHRGLVLTQLVGACLFTVNYLMIGAMLGCLINFICIFRSIVFSNKARFRADNPIWLIVFIGLFVASYVLTFTVFGTPPTVDNLLIEALAVIGMSASTIGYFLKDAKAVRRMGLIHSPAWLTYNCFRFTIGGVLCEAFSLISIFIAMWRYDIKKNRSRE